MQTPLRRVVSVIFSCALLICSGVIVLRSSAPTAQEKTPGSKKPAASENAADAYRLNTLGVAYMNQRRPADAQKYFEQALEADPKFAVARLNLGVSFLGQQKLEPARAALEEAPQQLPKDPYAWYNLGLAYRYLGHPATSIPAFRHAPEIAPTQPH